MSTKTLSALAWALSILAPAIAAEKESKPKAPVVPPPLASAAKVPDGFRVEVLVSDLTYPSSIEADDRGNLFVAETGYSYGDDRATPRILRVTPSGEITSFASQGLNGPINDLLWHEGRLYVSHRGKISAVESEGRVRDLITGLPSEGDHHNNQMGLAEEAPKFTRRSRPDDSREE